MCKKLILFVLAVGLALTSTASARLIGWFRLDETSGTIVADSSGQGNNGTIGGTPEWGAGKLGGAMQFSGDDSITLPAGTMGLGPNVGSVAFWVNTGAPSAIYTIFWAGDNTTGGGFGPENEMHVHLESAGTYWRGGEVSFYSPICFIHSDPTKGAAGSTPINPVLVADNVWHHVVATWGGDDGMAKLFIDGTMVSSASYAPPSWAFSNIFLGRMANSSRFFSGLLDEVRIYSHALSGADVKEAMLGSSPGPCSNPSPADKSTNVEREAVLGWAPGRYAQTHDVYMGTLFDDVNSASRTNPLGALVSQGQDGNTFDPTGLFEFGQTYYWRIDEVNAPDKPGLYKGNTWSFTTETYGYAVKPIKATASSFSNALTGPEKTIDGSGLDALDQHSTSASSMWLSKKAQTPVWIKYEFDRVYSLHQMWVWNQNQMTELDTGYGLKDVTIDVSTDGTTWTALASVPEFAQATGEDSYVHNTTVEFGGVLAKYVRLNINNNWGGAKNSGLSEVRFLYVPVKAYGPTPASGTTGVVVDGVLNWRSGRTAASHEVYLGTDPNALTKVSTVTEHRFGLGSAGVEYDMTYYWKVNEVNEAQSPTTWEGDVWSFTTPGYSVVDDFESYDDNCKRIFYTWVDGYGVTAPECGGSPIAGNGSGAAVGNLSAPYAERTILHDGKQAMPLFYDNPGATSNSEAIRTFAIPQDWIQGGVKTLVLYFHGDSTNAAGQLYVKINNTKVVYNGKSDVLTTPLWRQWNIDLASVGGALRTVGTLTIGVSGSGKGIVYVDDILLYRSAPVVAQPVDPGTTNRMAYYAMEGDAKDGSGRGYNGTLVGEPVFVDGAAGYGKALLFDGVNDHVELPIAPLLSTLTSATFTACVNFDTSGAAGWERVYDFGTGTTIYMFLTLRQGTTGLMRTGITLTGNTNQSNVDSGVPLPTGWHHVAVVIEGTTKIMQVYLDGSMVGSGPTTLVPKDLGTTTQNWLGRSQWTTDGYYKGMMDDFAIYNRVLSEGEVRYLAGDR